MTLFEYLVVLLSIVLSLGVVRLLDALPAALLPGRRDWLHLVWLAFVFLTHVQYWWVFWSYHDVTTWTYPGFVLALASPVLLYSLAITVAPRRAHQVESWRAYFWARRVRFFSLFAAWMILVSVANVLVLGQSFAHPVRAGQGTAVAFFVAGAASEKMWVHKLIAFVAILAYVALLTTMFFRPAPLVP